jgi:hypothetical protein
MDSFAGEQAGRPRRRGIHLVDVNANNISLPPPAAPGAP